MGLYMRMTLIRAVMAGEGYQGGMLEKAGFWVSRILDYDGLQEQHFSLLNLCLAEVADAISSLCWRPGVL